jgi:hypothetical protein
MDPTSFSPIASQVPSDEELNLQCESYVMTNET